MVLSDDMNTRQGIVEGSAAAFSNSWKASHICQDREDRLDDPCSFSVENGKLESVFVHQVYFLFLILLSTFMFFLNSTYLFSGFGLISNYKLVIGVDVSVNGCLSSMC